MPKSKSSKSVFCDCPCVGATLDKLVQPALLAILAHGPLHGYELARQIGEIPNFLDAAPDVSGVYRMLKSLEARGMVVSDWDVSQGHRSKRMFTITESGRHCLELWHQTLQDYRKALDSLLKTTANSLKR